MAWQQSSQGTLPQNEQPLHLSTSPVHSNQPHKPAAQTDRRVGRALWHGSDLRHSHGLQRSSHPVPGSTQSTLPAAGFCHRREAVACVVGAELGITLSTRGLENTATSGTTQAHLDT